MHIHIYIYIQSWTELSSLFRFFNSSFAVFYFFPSSSSESSIYTYWIKYTKVIKQKKASAALDGSERGRCLGSPQTLLLLLLLLICVCLLFDFIGKISKFDYLRVFYSTYSNVNIFDKQKNYKRKLMTTFSILFIQIIWLHNRIMTILSFYWQFSASFEYFELFSFIVFLNV